MQGRIQNQCCMVRNHYDKMVVRWYVTFSVHRFHRGGRRGCESMSTTINHESALAAWYGPPTPWSSSGPT